MLMKPTCISENSALTRKRVMCSKKQRIFSTSLMFFCIFPDVSTTCLQTTYTIYIVKLRISNAACHVESLPMVIFFVSH